MNKYQQELFDMKDEDLPEITLRKPAFIVDVETGGFDPTKNLLLQIGAVVLTDGPGDVKDELSLTILPTQEQYLAGVTEGAINVNGLTYEVLKDKGHPFMTVREEFAAFIKKNTVNPDWLYVGQNPKFDLKFLYTYLQEEMSARKLVGWSDSTAWDVIKLYSILETRGAVPYLKSKKGKNISLALGVEPEPDVHDGLEGARVVMRNFKRIVRLIKHTDKK